MTPKYKCEVFVSRRSEPIPPVDSFDEDLLRRDLASVASQPGIFAQYIAQSRVRFQKARERAVLEQWISFYEEGQRLLAAKTAMERGKSEYLQLAREHQIREADKGVALARLHADLEEENLRRDKAAYQRQNLERIVESGANPNLGESEEKLNQASQHRQLDIRWEIHESLGALTSLIELQHWRRQQRDRILRDRSLTSSEQAEDLRFVDDLYDQKRTELKVDTRIFEER